MFNNVIVTVRKKLVYARNRGQGNSCPAECEHSEELETRNLSVKITFHRKKVKEAKKSNK